MAGATLYQSKKREGIRGTGAGFSVSRSVESKRPPSTGAHDCVDERRSRAAPFEPGFLAHSVVFAALSTDQEITCGQGDDDRSDSQQRKGGELVDV
jgi:hypothetical protein